MASGCSLFEGTLEVGLGGSRGCSDPVSQDLAREGPLSNSGVCLATQIPPRSNTHRPKCTYFILRW